MGRIENIYEPPMKQATDLPKGVYLIAQPSVMSGAEPISGDVTTIECSVNEQLPMSELGSASIVVIEVDPASRNSLDRVDRLRKQSPHVPIIAGLANVDIATTRQLLRKGVNDIVALPFAIDELVAAIVDAAEHIKPDQLADSEPAPFVALVKSIGGSGSTTLITHLAPHLAEGMGDDSRACIIDLDLQSGDVAAYMGCSPRRNLADLLEADERLDEDLIASVVCEGHPRVDVIAAPTDIVPIESIDFEQLMQVVTLARRMYDVVLIDLPTSFTNWSLNTVFAADETIMVGLETIQSLRHAKRQLDFLVSMGIARDKIQVVLNRTEKRLFKTIDASDAANALKHPILATIGDEANLLRTAQDQGELVDAVQKRSKFTKDIMQLADLVAGRLAES